MLDAVTLEPAVFEPEQVGVLKTAFDLAVKRLDEPDRADAATRSEVARLVHNLARSRLKLNKPLRDAIDAATLAEEATEILAYMRQRAEPVVGAKRKGGGKPAPAVPIFPAAIRVPPSSVLRPR